MNDATPWLDADEQRLWRRWLLLHARLTATLNRNLEADSGLSLQDFEVLARLTDDPTGKLRINQLASSLDWERSRVSHQVRRMQRRGLVEREECPEDNRGAFVVLTPAGREAVEQAAPGHVRTVRRIVFDALTAEELHTLDLVNGKVLDRMETSSRRAEG